MTIRSFTARFYESGGKWPWIVLSPTGRIADGIAKTADEACENVEGTLAELRRNGRLQD